MKIYNFLTLRRIVGSERNEVTGDIDFLGKGGL